MAAPRPTVALLAERAGASGASVSRVLDGLPPAARRGSACCAGGGDLQTAITTVVMGGWDTDSDGATVGPVTGALAERTVAATVPTPQEASR